MEKISVDRIFLKGKLKENKTLIIEEGVIKEIISSNSVKGESLYIDDSIIIPGLIDTHIHGYKGVEVVEATTEDIEKMSLNLLESGVTAFLPTLQTDSEEKIERAILNIVKASKKSVGAKILGIFLEGPFLSEKFKGAQDDKYLQKPSIKLLKKWQVLAEGKIKKIAVAPELPGALELIEYATNNGIKVALGHSNGTAKETERAISKGASILVHTFNAMRGLHHREPGILGKSLISNDMFVEMICDGYHIHPDIAELIIKVKNKDKVVLITDGTLASGLSDGNYLRAGVPVDVKDGAVRTLEGKLAGSSLQLIQAIRNLVNWNISSLEESILMGTLNSARSLDLKGYGELGNGLSADFLILNKDLKIIATYIDGEKTYEK